MSIESSINKYWYEPIHPEITVKIEDDNYSGFAIVGIICREMKRAGIKESEINYFRSEAMSGSFEVLLQVCMKYVTIE